VQVKPEDFSSPIIEAIEDSIHRKYANKVLQEVGLCICIYDILKSSEGLIGQGDGLININGTDLADSSRLPSLIDFGIVVFRLIVFRPFKGEVMRGIVTRLDETGVRGLKRSKHASGPLVRSLPGAVGIDFFNDIWIPRDRLWDKTTL
jgi:DNA-directed RNA polymerase III subunit RPC8